MPKLAHLLAARAAARTMHFASGGKFRRGHGIRSRPPRQTPPSALIVGYAKEIRVRVVGVIRSELRALLAAIPRLVASHASERAPRRDQDDPVVSERFVCGVRVFVEVPAGQVRHANTFLGPVTMPGDYGRIPGARGADGDGLDAIVGPDDRSIRVFAIQQFLPDASGAWSYFQDKVMLGFDDPERARTAFVAAHGGDARYLGPMREVSPGDLHDAIDAALAAGGDMPSQLSGGIRATRAPRADAGEADEAMQLFAQAEAAVEDRVGIVLMREMARRYADDVNRKQASQLGAQLKALLGVDVQARARAEQAIIDTFVAENVALISGLSKRTLEKIARLTVRGLAAGTPASELSQQLQEQLRIADSKADLIAKDQLGKLNGQLNHERQQELGVKYFTWRHAGHPKIPRPDHVERDGKIFRFTDFDPDELPGQPIGCGCLAEPVVDVGAIAEARRARRAR
jgi:SPP1 gp7 family putative phage head morphogenesis protein